MARPLGSNAIEAIMPSVEDSLEEAYIQKDEQLVASALDAVEQIIDEGDAIYTTEGEYSVTRVETNNFDLISQVLSGRSLEQVLSDEDDNVSDICVVIDDLSRIVSNKKEQIIVGRPPFESRDCLMGVLASFPDENSLGESCKFSVMLIEADDMLPEINIRGSVAMHEAFTSDSVNGPVNHIKNSVSAIEFCEFTVSIDEDIEGNASLNTSRDSMYRVAVGDKANITEEGRPQPFNKLGFWLKNVIEKPEIFSETNSR
jgi:hypothetical protein